jgi:hypothetical protein
MFDRIRLGTLFLTFLVVPFVVGCGSSSQIDSITVSPATLTFTSVGSTATGQLTATGTINHGIHPSTTENVTNLVTWSSSSSPIATVGPKTGIVTAMGPGVAVITATMNGFTGVLSSSATVTVSLATGTGGESLVSIAVLPSTLTVDNLLGTGQFLAYGTFSTPPLVMDITNGFSHVGFPPSCTAEPCPFVPVTWVSGFQNIFPVTSSGAPGATGGLVTAVGSGTDDVYAVAANPDGTVVYSASSTFNCPLALPSGNSDGTCNSETIAPSLLVTLTVYNQGLDQTNWLVTAPSATGTADVIRCGPGWAAEGNTSPSVCTATYPVNTNGQPTVITLTATQTPGSVGTFGGWSWDCTPNPNPPTAAGPNSCAVELGTVNFSDVSVGVIFN